MGMHPPLLFTANHGARSPTVSHQGLHPVANDTADSFSCILHNAGEGGEREADRLNWVCCSPPTALRGVQAPKVQSACFPPPPPLLFRSDISAFNEASRRL